MVYGFDGWVEQSMDRVVEQNGIWLGWLGRMEYGQDG